MELIFVNDLKNIERMLDNPLYSSLLILANASGVFGFWRAGVDK